MSDSVYRSLATILAVNRAVGIVLVSLRSCSSASANSSGARSSRRISKRASDRTPPTPGPEWLLYLTFAVGALGAAVFFVREPAPQPVTVIEG